MSGFIFNNWQNQYNYFGTNLESLLGTFVNGNNKYKGGENTLLSLWGEYYTISL